VALGPLETLSFDHVGFTHLTAAHPALSDIVFEVRRGETIAFVGPSGAGKTTLVKLLVGLYAPAGADPLHRNCKMCRQRAARARRLRHAGNAAFPPGRFAEPAVRAARREDAECLDVLKKANASRLWREPSRGLTPHRRGWREGFGGERQRPRSRAPCDGRNRSSRRGHPPRSTRSPRKRSRTRSATWLATEAITILIAHRLDDHARRPHHVRSAVRSSRACTRRSSKRRALLRDVAAAGRRATAREAAAPPPQPFYRGAVGSLLMRPRRASRRSGWRAPPSAWGTDLAAVGHQQCRAAEQAPAPSGDRPMRWAHHARRRRPGGFDAGSARLFANRPTRCACRGRCVAYYPTTIPFHHEARGWATATCSATDHRLPAPGHGGDRTHRSARDLRRRRPRILIGSRSAPTASRAVTGHLPRCG
jgi:energy-coupling factor transporter ATP-binding protein EcfA2